MTRSIRHSIVYVAVYVALSLMISPATWAALNGDGLDGDALAERLAAHAPQCGRFDQSRWLADLDAQLDSRGYFEQQANGLVWQTTSPVRDRVVMSEDNDELPMGFQVVAPVLGGLLSGNWQRLESHFTIELSGALDDWQAKLTPSEVHIAERLSQLLVQGNQQVEHVELMFTNDDRLNLTLAAVDCASLEEGDRSL
ncbi:LolA-related protein [Vreelandella titanicae]|uniref:LolA-related protein n=1 Tax=Vreelandella titanicae TaxID=664683 RepID=UPI00315B072A